MKFEKTDVFNIKSALRGMRNPMESCDKSDSYYGCKDTLCCACDKNVSNCVGSYIIGEKDLSLAQKLVRAGSDHSKFMRQIIVSVDITAPLYWWKEFDTYKVGTVANSESTMHKLAETPISMECFELNQFSREMLTMTDLIGYLETIRLLYQETNDKEQWKTLVQLLPESWLQKRTVTMSYQNIRNMYYARWNHKLTEWSDDFSNWTRTLPYAENLILMK